MKKYFDLDHMLDKMVKIFHTHLRSRDHVDRTDESRSIACRIVHKQPNRRSAEERKKESILRKEFRRKLQQDKYASEEIIASRVATLVHAKLSSSSTGEAPPPPLQNDVMNTGE